MTSYHALQNRLTERQYVWLITGVADFIDCNLLVTLLKLVQRVAGLASFTTGYRRNLAQIQAAVSPVHFV